MYGTCKPHAILAAATESPPAPQRSTSPYSILRSPGRFKSSYPGCLVGLHKVGRTATLRMTCSRTYETATTSRCCSATWHSCLMASAQTQYPVVVGTFMLPQAHARPCKEEWEESGRGHARPACGLGMAGAPAAVEGAEDHYGAHFLFQLSPPPFLCI